MTRTIIEWDRNQVILARGSVSGDRVLFDSVSVLDRVSDKDDSDETLRRLKSLLPTATGKTLPQAGVVFPRQSVTIHRIQLPQVPDHEVPDIVRLQAGVRLTVPVDSVCLDFTPLPARPGSTSRDVLLVTIPKDQVAAVEKILASCQTVLSEVRVSAFCIATAAARAGLLKAATDPAVLDVLILLRQDFIEVTFLSGTSVVFSHSGASWTTDDGVERAVRSELNRARMAASESLGEHRIGRLLLVGSPEVTARVSDQIASRADNAVPERIDPATVFLQGAGPANVSASTLVAISGAMSVDRTPLVEGVDLIHPRRPPEQRDLRRVKVLSGVLAAVLIIGLVWNWRHRQLQVLVNETAQLEAQISDLQSALSLGEPDQKLAALLAHWSQRDVNWLDEMARLRAILLGTDRLITKEFQFLRRDRDGIASIRLEGKARSIDDVDALSRRLAEAGYLVAPPDRKSSQRDAEYPVELTLQVTIPEPVSGTPTAAGPAGSRGNSPRNGELP